MSDTVHHALACARVLAILLALFLAWAPLAQTDTDSLPEIEIENLLERAVADEALAGFDVVTLAEQADTALREGKFSRARTLTEEILRRDSRSIAGHCLMGMIHHHGEANLPRALYHLELSRELAESGEGSLLSEGNWHALATLELVGVTGSMGRHEEKIYYLDELELDYGLSFPADYGWPLMRLRRYEEAREQALKALMLGDRDQTMIARTALCAIEAEQQKRQEGYEACLQAATLAENPGPTVYSNAAEAALGVLRLDEAERHLLEASRQFRRGTISNPWMDLMQLYVGQGRLTEAVDAMRRMIRWRRSQPPEIDEQNRTETELASAILLIAAGRGAEAAEVTERALKRPDRTGFTSSESEQMEAANALVDRMAQHLAAEQAAEDAAAQPFWNAAARLEVAQRRFAAWRSGRRAAALLADERFLLATLRPYLAGSMEAPEWISPELVEPLGAGVVKAALAEARRREGFPEEGFPGTEGYFEVFALEIAIVKGRWQEAVEHAERALAELPGSEVMLQARAASRGALAALERGERQRALEWLDLTLQLDPGALRRHGPALPAAFEASGDPVAQIALRYLRRSPRFDDSGGGFRVQIDGDGSSAQACLFGPQQTRLACARVTPRAGEESEDLARRLAHDFHVEAFAPRLDLTQADLQTLDGSPTAAGGRASDRLHTVLDGLSGGG